MCPLARRHTAKRATELLHDCNRGMTHEGKTGFGQLDGKYCRLTYLSFDNSKLNINIRNFMNFCHQYIQNIEFQDFFAFAVLQNLNKLIIFRRKTDFMGFASKDENVYESIAGRGTHTQSKNICNSTEKRSSYEVRSSLMNIHVGNSANHWTNGWMDGWITWRECRRDAIVVVSFQLSTRVWDNTNAKYCVAVDL